MSVLKVLLLLIVVVSVNTVKAREYRTKFDSLFNSAPITKDSISFYDMPNLVIPRGETLLLKELVLQNNNSLTIHGRLEVDMLIVESGSISSISSSGVCFITGNLYLKKNSTLAIEGHVEVLGNVISESNTGLIMHAGSLLQVGGNMEGSVSTHIIGSGKVSVKGFVSGGFMHNSIINKVWPYELIHFSSENTGALIELEWATMSEFVNKEFVIQKSADGLLFEDRFVVPAYGNENAINYYSIVDVEPFPGFNYYRLKQVDCNGRSGHSEVITSFMFSALDQLRIVPKPIFHEVDVYYPQKYSTIAIQLEDGAGNVQITEVEYSYPCFVINTAQIGTGIYYVNVEIDGIAEKRPVSIIN